MKAQVIKTNGILPDNIQKALTEAGIEGFEIGSVWIRDNGGGYHYLYKITGIRTEKNGEVRILCLRAQDWEATEWSSENSMRLDEWDAVKLDKPYQEYREESLKIISGEVGFDKYEDKASDVVESETAIVGKNSKESLTALQQSLDEKRKRAELVKTFVGLEMERKKRELDKVRRRLEGIVTVFEKKIKRVMRVIKTIELYLGIDEELMQLQEGKKADESTPISFRQMVLFMDEETAEDEKLGNIEGGLDFTNIDLFDQYLLKNDNYKKLVGKKERYNH